MPAVNRIGVTYAAVRMREHGDVGQGSVVLNLLAGDFTRPREYNMKYRVIARLFCLGHNSLSLDKVLHPYCI